MRERMKTVIRRSWAAIAYDIIESVNSCGDELTDEMAWECSIDAGRLHTFGHDKEAARAFDELGYEEGNELAKEALGRCV